MSDRQKKSFSCRNGRGGFGKHLIFVCALWYAVREKKKDIEIFAGRENGIALILATGVFWDALKQSASIYRKTESIVSGPVGRTGNRKDEYI